MYSRRGVNHAKQSAADALTTTLKRFIQKTAEATGYLIGNNTVDSITKSQEVQRKISCLRLLITFTTITRSYKIKQTLNSV